MPHYRKLVGQRVYLSPPCLEDAEKWAEWENDLEVALPLGDEAVTVISLEKERDHLAEDLRAQRPVFTIVDLESDRPIGRCMLFNLDTVNRRAMLGILIGEKTSQNRGCGQEAMRLLLDYAFQLLNLHSVWLGVFAFNERAIAVYRKLGFREIGRMRQARIIAGKCYDILLMDLLAEEFSGSLLAERMP